MKKALLLLSSIALFGACSKEINPVKTTVTNNGSISKKQPDIARERQVLSPFSVQNKNPDVGTLATPPTTLTALTSDVFVPMETDLLVPETSTVMNKAGLPAKIAAISKTRVRLQDAVKRSKELKKEVSAKPAEGGKTLSVISLISSVVGVFLLVAGLPGIGILLSLAGLLTGIIALVLKPKKKLMSILGIVVGGIVILFFAFFAIAFSGGFS